MKRKQVLCAGISLATMAVLASGCSSSGGSSSSKSTSSSGEQVGIILPDAVTSPRWMNADQPALQAQCAKDGLSCDIQNANDSDATELSEGENMIDNEHVQVLVIASIDQPTAETLTTKAHAAGVKVIDYDRVYGGAGSEPDYYVSFNGVTVGQQQGTALVAAIKAAGISKPDVAVLNGATTDGNAVEFNKGYMSVLQPLFTAGTYKESANTWVTGWDNPTALKDFEADYSADSSINVIMVANDGMADAIIPFLQEKSLAGKIIVSGQDASALGLQEILEGNQTFTIYKPSTLEAVPTVDLAKEIVGGNNNPTSVDGYKFTSESYSTTSAAIPSILQTSTVVNINNVAVPVTANYTPYASVCDTAALIALCTSHSITAPAAG